MSAASELRSDLIDLMIREGRRLVVVRNVPGNYNPSTQIAIPNTDDDEFVGIGRVGSYDDRSIDGKQILREDRRVTFIPTEELDYTDLVYAAKVGDIVYVKREETYRVLDFQKRELGGELICWTFHVRNG